MHVAVHLDAREVVVLEHHALGLSSRITASNLPPREKVIEVAWLVPANWDW
jgi:hypothetical protein